MKAAVPARPSGPRAASAWGCLQSGKAVWQLQHHVLTGNGLQACQHHQS